MFYELLKQQKLSNPNIDTENTDYESYCWVVVFWALLSLIKFYPEIAYLLIEKYAKTQFMQLWNSFRKMNEATINRYVVDSEGLWRAVRGKHHEKLLWNTIPKFQPIKMANMTKTG